MAQVAMHTPALGDASMPTETDDTSAAIDAANKSKDAQSWAKHKAMIKMLVDSKLTAEDLFEYIESRETEHHKIDWTLVWMHPCVNEWFIKMMVGHQYHINWSVVSNHPCLVGDMLICYALEYSQDLDWYIIRERRDLGTTKKWLIETFPGQMIN